MKACSTHTAAFTGHGITDGTNLVSNTYYWLAANGHRSPEATSEFADKVGIAFRQAFIRSATVPLVPEPIGVAIEESTDVIVHRILDNPDADLRTDILPVFYQLVASAYCAHLDAGGDPGTVGIWYKDDDDDDGGIPVEHP